MSPTSSLLIIAYQVGDHVIVDGGMVTLDVTAKAGPDVTCSVADPGIILSRANLTFRRDGQTVRARNSMLPVLSSKVCCHSLHMMQAPSLHVLPHLKTGLAVAPERHCFSLRH